MRIKLSILLAITVFSFGCSGKTSEELYANGVKLLREGNPNAAIVLFRNSLEKDQNKIDARYQLAMAYMAVKKFELAEKELQKVKMLNPNQEGIKLDLARVYNELGKPELAMTFAGEHLALEPESPDALEVIGVAHSISKMPREAEAYFLRAIEKEPGRTSAKLELAALYAGEGKSETAKALLLEVVKNAPGNSRALYLLADMETMLEKNTEALAIYKKLAEINPADPQAPYKAGLLHFNMGHHSIAETIAGDVVKKFPANAEGYRLKGMVSYRKKEFKEAISSLQNANKITPSVIGYYFLGLSLYGNGDLESALSQFRQILDRAPTFHQARLLTGMILLQQQRVEDSISELTRLLESDGKNPLAHNLLGSAYMAKGLYEEGMRELETAIKLDPGLIDAYLKKGVFHLSQGKTAEVEVDLKTAIRVAPEILNTRLILASFYENQNNRAKALATLEEGLNKSKQDAVLYCAMARILFADKKPVEAVELLNRAKKSNNASVAPYFILAGHYASIRDTERALREYAEVLRKEPGNLKGMLQTASLLQVSNRQNEALGWYQKALETRKPEASLALSGYYEKRGDLTKALSILAEFDRFAPRSAAILEQRVRLHLEKGEQKEALKVCSDMEAVSQERAASSKVAVYMAMKKIPEAIKEGERAILLNPASANGYMLLASVYQEQNSTKLAMETLKNGIKRDADDPRPALALAGLYSAAGNHAQAQAVCDDILRKTPKYAPAYFAQGTFLEAKGDKQGAVKKYLAALAISKEYAAPLNNLAYLYLDGYGNKEEALRLAERALALEPENPGVLDTVSYALVKNGRPQEAREYLQKALTIVPDDPTINYRLAVVHQASGDRKKAVERLKIALRTDKFEEAPRARSLLTELD